MRTTKIDLPSPHQTAIEQRSTEQLKPHPRNSDFFPPAEGQAYKDLKHDIQANGIRTPLIVQPDGTILAGHQRWRVAIDLRLTSVPVIIRHDLAGNDAGALQVVLSDNFHRRQLSPLQRARCAKQLQAIAQADRKAGKLAIRHGTTLRDHLGQLLGLGGRQLDRLLSVLDTPPEVQSAVEVGELSIVKAGAVANLDPSTQANIAAEIKRQGVAAADRIVGAALAQERAHSHHSRPSYRKFLAELRHHLNAYRDKLDHVSRGDEDELKVIEMALDFFKAARSIVKQQIRKDQAEWRRMEAQGV